MPGEPPEPIRLPTDGLRLWNSFDSIRRGALARARAHNHREVNEAHLASELLASPEVRRLAEVLRNDLDELELVVEGTVDETPPQRWYSLRIRRPTAGLWELYQRAFVHAMGADLDAVRPGLLLVAMLSAEPRSLIAERLAVYGFEPLAVRLFYAHGRVSDAPLPTGSGPARLVVLNDPFSTMDLVVDIFEQVVGLDRPAALRLMREIHVRGRAHVSSLPFADARRMGDDVRREARSRGYPLDVTIERAT